MGVVGENNHTSTKPTPDAVELIPEPLTQPKQQPEHRTEQQQPSAEQLHSKTRREKSETTFLNPFPRGRTGGIEWLPRGPYPTSQHQPATPVGMSEDIARRAYQHTICIVCVAKHNLCTEWQMAQKNWSAHKKCEQCGFYVHNYPTPCMNQYNVCLLCQQKNY